MHFEGCPLPQVYFKGFSSPCHLNTEIARHRAVTSSAVKQSEVFLFNAPGPERQTEGLAHGGYNRLSVASFTAQLAARNLPRLWPGFCSCGLYLAPHKHQHLLSAGRTSAGGGASPFPAVLPLALTAQKITAILAPPRVPAKPCARPAARRGSPKSLVCPRGTGVAGLARQAWAADDFAALLEISSAPVFGGSPQYCCIIWKCLLFVFLDARLSNRERC